MTACLCMEDSPSTATPVLTARRESPGAERERDGGARERGEGKGGWRGRGREFVTSSLATRRLSTRQDCGVANR